MDSLRLKWFFALAIKYWCTHRSGGRGLARIAPDGSWREVPYSQESGFAGARVQTQSGTLLSDSACSVVEAEAVLAVVVAPAPSRALEQLASALRYDTEALSKIIDCAEEPPQDPPPLVILDPALTDGRLRLPRSYAAGMTTVVGLAEAPTALGAIGGLTPVDALAGLFDRLGARQPEHGAVLATYAPDLPLPPSSVWATAAAAIRRLRPVTGDGLWSSIWRGDPTFYDGGRVVPWRDDLDRFAAPACVVCGPIDPAELLLASMDSRHRGESPRVVSGKLDRSPERVALYLGSATNPDAVELALTAWRAGAAVELRRIGVAEVPRALQFFRSPDESPLLTWLPAACDLRAAAEQLYPEQTRRPA